MCALLWLDIHISQSYTLILHSSTPTQTPSTPQVLQDWAAYSLLLARPNGGATTDLRSLLDPFGALSVLQVCACVSKLVPYMSVYLDSYEELQCSVVCSLYIPYTLQPPLLMHSHPLTPFNNLSILVCLYQGPPLAIGAKLGLRCSGGMRWRSWFQVSDIHIFLGGSLFSSLQSPALALSSIHLNIYHTTIPPS